MPGEARPALCTIMVLAAGFTGCLGEGDDGPGTVPGDGEEARAWRNVTAISDCPSNPTTGNPSCYEPTVAVDPAGRVFVTGYSETLVRSLDRGTTFEDVGTPPIPEAMPPEASTAENLVQVGPEGSLYFSALVAAPDNRGIQVARSDDGGETWAVNEAISLPSHPTPGGTQPDRQWLAFGPDDRVYLVYIARIPLGTVLVQSSQDRGQTWSDPVVVATPDERGEAARDTTGRPVVDANGTVFVPFWGMNTQDPQRPWSAMVAVSTDGGTSWQTHEALRSDSHENWPMLASDARGRLHLAVDTEQGLVVTTSADAAETWSKPVTWATEDPATAPWIRATGGNLTVAYHLGDEGNVSAHVASRSLDEEPSRGPTDHRQVARELPSVGTDFTHLSVGSAGPWVPWFDSGADEIRLAGPGTERAGG